MPGKQDVINQDIDRLKNRVSKGSTWIQSQNSHTTTKTTDLKTEQRVPLQEVIITSQGTQETELLQSNNSVASNDLHESTKNPGFMKTAGYFTCPGCDPEGILVSGSNSGRCQCSHAHQKGSSQAIKLGQLVSPIIINERVEEPEVNEHVITAGATLGSTVETERAALIQETIVTPIEEAIIINTAQPVQQSIFVHQQGASQVVGTGQQASQIVGIGQQASQVVGNGQQASQVIGIGQQASPVVGTGQQASQIVGIGQQTSQIIDERVLEQRIVDEHIVDGARIVSQELHPEQSQVYEERLGSTVETEIIEKVTTPIQRTVVTPVEQKVMVPVEKTIVTNVAQKIVTPIEKTVMTQVPRKVIEYVQQNVTEYETRTITEPVQKTITEPVQRTIYEEVPQTVVENVKSTVITPVTQKVIVPVEQTIVKNITQTTMVPVTQTFVSHEGGRQQTQSSQSQFIQQGNQFSSQPMFTQQGNQFSSQPMFTQQSSQFSSQPIVGAGSSQVNGQKKKHHFFSRRFRK